MICREISKNPANHNYKNYNISVSFSISVNNFGYFSAYHAIYAEFHFKSQVSLSGHLFDQFLINEALDIIEAAGGSFHLVKCDVGQCSNSLSFSELEVSRPLASLVIGEVFTLVSSSTSYLYVKFHSMNLLLWTGGCR